MPTPYRYELFRSTDAVDQAAWEAVAGVNPSVFLDLRFLRAVERSFAAESEFWYAIFRDESGTAVAATCFSSYLVDGSLMAPPLVQRLTAGVRKIWSGFFKYRLLIGGVPVSTCSHQLAIAPDADPERVAAGLTRAAHEIAREAGCWLMSFKEFGNEAAARIEGLTKLGFLKARSVYAYDLDGEFGSFAAYIASRSKRTRGNIRRHLKKGEEAGLTCEHLRGKDGADRLFTPEVHRLYLNVLERAKVRFESLPASFFQELARQMPEESCFTIIRQEGRIVGFCCGVAAEAEHALLFCGMDYEINRETDLYFNVIFRALEQGMAPGVQVVRFGAAADEFKQRLGCTGEWLSVYVKGANALMHLGLRCVFPLLFDTRDGVGAPPPGGHQQDEGPPEPVVEVPLRRAA